MRCDCYCVFLLSAFSSIFCLPPILAALAGKENDEPARPVGRGGDHDGDEEAGDNQQDQQEPRNRNELYKMFNSRGPTNMIATFMGDQSLKQIAYIIEQVSSPLELSYYHTLKQVSAGWETQAKWGSQRAAGSWMETVVAILQTLNSKKLRNDLGMTPSMQLAVPPEDFPLWALEEVETLKRAYNFAVSLAGHWLWSNVHFFLEFPAVIASVLHPDEEVATEAFEHMRKLARAVNLAEQSLNPDVQQVLNDLGWHHQQLARESMALVLKGRKEEVIQLAKRLMKGTPSTKDVLENCFAFLHQKVAASTVNQKMNDFSKYLYTIGSPYAESGGVPQVLPTREDFHALSAPQGFALRMTAHRRLFSPQLSLFPNPKAVPKPGQTC